MAASLNKVSLIGNVGRDPEIRDVSTSMRVANLTIATSENWKDKATGERKERTEWHRVSVMNDGLVRVVEQYVKKGSRVYIEGSLQTRKWTDKEGKERFSTEVVLSGFGGQLILLGDAGGRAAPDQGGNATRSQTQAPATAGSGIDDEIPF